MEFTAREWRKIWRWLSQGGDFNLASRIEDACGEAWQAEDWQRRIEMDLAGDEQALVREAAGRTAITTT